MKRFLIMLTSLIVVQISLIGCQVKNNFSSDDNLSTSLSFIMREQNAKLEIISLEPEKPQYSIKENNLFFFLSNLTEQNINYIGKEAFQLDVKKNEEWYRISGGIPYDTPYSLPAKVRANQNIPFKAFWNYDFEPGHYRLVFELDGKWTAAEFDLIE